MPNYTTSLSATGGSPTAVPLPEAVMTVYSREILWTALPLLMFEQIVERKEELGAIPGQEIVFTKYASLARGGQLVENTPMETQNLAASQITLTVYEHGNAVSVQEALLRASWMNVLNDTARLLGMDYATYRDEMIRDELLGSANVLFAAGRSARTQLTSGDVFDTRMVKDATELLANNKTPKFTQFGPLPAYICFVSPHQARGIRDDKNWINAQNYGPNDNILRGEIGKYEDVRFIETTQITYIQQNTGKIYSDNADSGNVAGTYSANADVHQALIVGDHAIGLGTSLDAELRDDGVHDFGREHKLGWYGIWGVKRIEEGHSAVLETA